MKGRWPGLIVTLWSVLGLFVAVGMMGYSFLDTAFAGDMGLAIDSDNPHPRVDRVRYTLAGLTYLHGDQVLTGPHRSLLLTLGWLALSTLLMWGLWRRWAVASARRALRVSVVALALVVVVGGATLFVATWKHGRMLSADTVGLERPVSMTSASPLTLHLWSCGRWVESHAAPGCQDIQRSTFPNPTLWGLVGVLVTAGAGLWRPSGRDA
ncbi:hypothetical protein F8S09_15670 [Deinococcus sp. SDU3-2]|uniref:Uncharacterized protein n=1 Tax=Deinococcus terrestris TaxID=2651870 RepID=A0A7X1TSR5_9DEIO|nr:hypothetical protein [Deinococcus terrestris]MPY68095.1 hypothetical protein [Deinococcus terrestris]